MDVAAASEWVGQHLVLGVLVLTRLGMVMMALPSVGGGVPRRIRALLALTATAVLLPTVAALPNSTDLPPIDSVIDLGVAIAREAAVGMFIGGTAQVLMAGLQLGGEFISGTGGMQLGDAIDPSTGANMPVIARLVGFLVTAIMLATGGHRLVLGLLLDSFQLLPPADVEIGATTIAMVVDQMGAAMVAGVRLAAPVVATLLLTNLITGLISRTLPQINVLAIGLSINAFAMLIVLAITIGSAGLLFQEELARAVASVRGMW
ncbi:MAG: flagellar biosynthetic protein FliR [Planctomycetota bacterium]